MSESIRINTTPNGSDKYVKVNLEQDFDFIEILSLKISQEDAYRKFCSDYGVIVGRVIINSGFGVPNAKVSVFIPIDDIDKEDPLISGLYPYETVSDKNAEGVRYNLLPKDGDESNDCSTPIGSFPNKREVLDNETMLGIYCKYYKFTTTTNHAGDFMIFGVPLGQYTVHVDADISDIGIASQRPYDMISQGTPAKMFTSPTKFSYNTNLDKLIQVKSMNVGVNVQPFWGDIENCEIGISRVDFDMNYNLQPSAIFMGSIFGDQDKHSINKQCRPRRRLGEVCEQVVGPGSINMIRKTVENGIEDFDVDGGRVIDDDGAWAYQIPMNLDYMVTNEFGDLVLSNDPNKGVPTRARVRFKIGMDETGGEGRLRTRAKYLVPNNPNDSSEIDYSFGEETDEVSFRDIYWNKIYTVSNFISRFQTQGLLVPTKTRAITGVKDVDACAGSKSPFPYNKIDVTINPIFIIICILIRIMAFLIYIMNNVVIYAINGILEVLNGIIRTIKSFIDGVITAINKVPWVSVRYPSWGEVDYVPCLYVACPADEPKRYAPGCFSGTKGLEKAQLPAGSNYCDGTNNVCSITGNFTVGLDKCMALAMAIAMNLFQFDFYNDWVNGSLYGFLLKYKKKRNQREKFCEYDCSDFVSDPNYTGVDSDGNGTKDNRCHTNYLLDTCYDGAANSQEEHREISLHEGLIKNVDGELFYAASTHSSPFFKMFATDIVCLGSVFSCDWQGVPKINDLLTPTSYQRPPDFGEVGADGTTLETCGMSSDSTNMPKLFFDIDCLGIHVNTDGCLNVRHICEIGVDIPAEQNGTSAECFVGQKDIDGKFFRDVFYGLNNSSSPYGITTLPAPIDFSTNFNTDSNKGKGNYDFANDIDNGPNYAEFRGYGDAVTGYNDNTFLQPNHSFFFYFGLTPGRTALDKMNQRFFTSCIPVADVDLLIQASSVLSTGTVGTLGTGSITFSILGGVGPYSYTVTGMDSLYTNIGTIATENTSVTLSQLVADTYLISMLDAHNNPVSKTVIVSGPTPLYASVIRTKNATTSNSNDGIITILAIGGGLAPYTYTLVKNGVTIIPTTTIGIGELPKELKFLPIDNDNDYSVTIVDSIGGADGTFTVGNLFITGPDPLLVSISKTDISCKNASNGTLTVTATGGLTPYQSITTRNNVGFNGTLTNFTGLGPGTYETTVVDALGTPAVSNTVIIEEPSVQPSVSTDGLNLGQQCDPTKYIIPFTVAGIASGPVECFYLKDTTGAEIPVTLTYAPIMYMEIPKTDIDTITQISYRIQSTKIAGVYCTSNKKQVNKTDIALPPTWLTLSLGTAEGSCVPLRARFNVKFSHTVRAPYTIKYSFDASNYITYTFETFSPVSTAINNEVDIVAPAGSYNIYVTVTDSKGCESPAIPVPVKVPATALAGTVTTSRIAAPFNWTITMSGGIPPYTSVPSSGPVFVGNVATISTGSATHTATVKDANGCQITITGNA